MLTCTLANGDRYKFVYSRYNNGGEETKRLLWRDWDDGGYAYGKIDAKGRTAWWDLSQFLKERSVRSSAVCNIFQYSKPKRLGLKNDVQYSRDRTPLQN